MQCFDTTFYKSGQQIDFVCQLEVNSSMGGEGGGENEWRQQIMGHKLTSKPKLTNFSDGGKE